MRTYDDDPLRAAKVRRKPEKEADGLDATIAHRAVADRRPEALGTRSVMHLQRAAGNSSVGALLQEERSPVLDVVGKGGGQALDAETRGQMEGAMGHDFSDVRVHTGGEASKSAASVQAQAYTVGNDIVFQGGNFNPSSDSGKRMLAHELTHVVQQRSGAVDGTPQAGGISVSDPSDRFEQAAEANADHVMSHGHADPSAVGGAAPVAARSVQRDLDEAGENGMPAVGAAVQRQEEEVPEEEATE